MHKKCIRKKYAIRGQRMFVKFPSTPYIEFENNMDIRTDKILSKEEVHIFLGNEIYVEEKIDGANLGISFNDRGECLLQNRGDYLYFPLSGQWSALNKWLNINENTIFENITNEYLPFPNIGTLYNPIFSIISFLRWTEKNLFSFLSKMSNATNQSGNASYFIECVA